MDNYLSGVYKSITYWTMVYHTQPYSVEVEFVSVNPKFFKSKEKALKWFKRKHRDADFIQPEAMAFTGFGGLKIIEEPIQGWHCNAKF